MATNKTPEQIAAEKAAKEQVAAEKTAAKQKVAEEQAAKDEVAKKADEEKTAKEQADAEKDPHKALVAQYKKAYPKNGELHITTDGQVFLAPDKSLAQLHQRSLSGNGEVKTYKTK